MKLKVGEKEYNIKFAYKPTLKERIVSKFVKFSSLAGKDGGTDLEKVEDLLLFLPEALLVGLQVHHPEFKYDCDTGEGKSEKLDKAFSLVEEYMDSEDADVMEFFNQLQEALQQDSFLKSLFQKEQKKIEQIEETVQPKPKAAKKEN